MSTFQTVNPYTQQVIKGYEYQNYSDALIKVKEFSLIQKKWQNLNYHERGQHLLKVAERIRAGADQFALQISTEMGKPLVHSKVEIEKCAQGLEKFVALTSSFESEKNFEANYKNNLLKAEPYGLILSIQPWNFPFWQVFRMASAAWMAGNLVILKHSDITAGCAVLIEEICKLEDFSLLINLRLSHEDTARLIQQQEVQMVTLTGSTRAGRQVGSVAGAALKKQLLELGGSDAYIIMPDADLKVAVKNCVRSRMMNSGQSCIAAKRFFIHENIFEEFKKLFISEQSKYTFGDPQNSKTLAGPLAAKYFVTCVHEQIKKAELIGGIFTQVEILNLNENIFSPVGIIDFGHNLSAFEAEEFFAPIALIYKFNDINLVIQAVNNGPYGLGGAVFTADLVEAKRIADDMQVGMFSINSMVQSDAMAPFGGTKNSGLGRESGLIGLNEFISWKFIGIN